MLRTIATARIVLPTSIIRLAAGRQLFSESEQAMCFMAGANAVFTGERMLTTPTTGWDQDKTMLETWGLRGMRSFEEKRLHRLGPKAEAEAPVQAQEATTEQAKRPEVQA